MASLSYKRLYGFAQALAVPSILWKLIKKKQRMVGVAELGAFVSWQVGPSITCCRKHPYIGHEPDQTIISFPDFSFNIIIHQKENESNINSCLKNNSLVIQLCQMIFMNDSNDIIVSLLLKGVDLIWHSCSFF